MVIEHTKILLRSLTALQAPVEVLEVLHKGQCLERRVLIYAEALPQLGSPIGEERVGRPEEARDSAHGEQQVLDGVPEERAVAVGGGLLHVLQRDHRELALALNLNLEMPDQDLLHRTSQPPRSLPTG